MEQRVVRIAIAITVGLLAGLWAINNLLNWVTARGAVAYALSQENQSGYSTHIVPAITSGAAATVGLTIIIATEIAASVLSLWGAWRMWKERRGTATAFTAAKRVSILGAGVAVLNWFLGFVVIGGAALMMGQAEGMEGAVRGATNMAMLSFLSLIYLSMVERDI